MSPIRLTRGLGFREHALQNFVDGLRVGLAASFAHHLADEEFEDAFVAGAVFREVVGVLGDDFASGFFDDAGIRDLGEAFGGDDFGGGLAGVEHGGEDFFSAGGSDGAFFDGDEQFG